MTHQRCPWHELKIDPVPVGRSLYVDAFGNPTVYFEIEGKHEALDVTARSFVEVLPTEPHDPGSTPPWERVRDACCEVKLTPGSDAGMYRFASPMVPVGLEFGNFALPDFTPGRPVLEAALALTARIFHNFRFDPRATDVTTPVDEVLRKRAGVCQDFAHLNLALLRAMGIPSWYVSGYLHPSSDAEVDEVITGESHAWVAAFTGSVWPLDPTSMHPVAERHVRVAAGRDYHDVAPFRGIYAGTATQQLEVTVEIARTA